MANPSGSLYLNLIWHQHQSMYLDSERDQLQGQWVRAHGAKDSYELAAMLEEFPEIRCTFNLA